MGKEDCDVCGTRVFLMERLAIEGHVLHTACFKCTLCSVQLKPGAYDYDPSTDQFYCRKDYRDLLRQQAIKQTMKDKGIRSFEEGQVTPRRGSNVTSGGPIAGRSGAKQMDMTPSIAAVTRVGGGAVEVKLPGPVSTPEVVMGGAGQGTGQGASQGAGQGAVKLSPKGTPVHQQGKNTSGVGGTLIDKEDDLRRELPSLLKSVVAAKKSDASFGAGTTVDGASKPLTEDGPSRPITEQLPAATKTSPTKPSPEQTKHAMPAGVSAGVNTGVSAGVNTGVSAGVNTGVSAGVNTGVSAGVNTGVSAGVNTGVSTCVSTGEATVPALTPDKPRGLATIQESEGAAPSVKPVRPPRVPRHVGETSVVSPSIIPVAESTGVVRNVNPAPTTPPVVTVESKPRPLLKSSTEPGLQVSTINVQGVTPRGIQDVAPTGIQDVTPKDAKGSTAKRTPPVRPPSFKSTRPQQPPGQWEGRRGEGEERGGRERRGEGRGRERRTKVLPSFMHVS